MSTICVDSGFLIALYDETDEYHESAQQYFITYFEKPGNELLVPWPILYESISTRMARNRKRITTLHRDWKYLETQEQLILLDDKEFRLPALDECFKEIQRPQAQYRALSLTDRIIRKMLSEPNIKIDYFITYNHGDFVDICKKYHRILLASSDLVF